MILTPEQKSFLLSYIIGDGFISKSDRIEIEHSVKQLDYLQFKKEILEKELNLETINVSKRSRKLKNKFYITYIFGLSLKKRFNLKGLRKEIYCDDGKKSYKKILDQTTNKNFLISIWFGDDGSVGYRRTNNIVNSAHLDLHTCDQNYKKQLELVKWFKKNFNVKPNIKIMKSTKQKTSWFYLSFKQNDSMILWSKIRSTLLKSDSMKHKFRYIEEKYNRNYKHLEYNLSARPQNPT